MNYFDLMQPIIQKAGDLVKSRFRKNIEVSSKDGHGIVTNIDVESQNILIEGFLKALPGSGYIAEEAKNQNIAEFTWVIDPIDGTKNFVRGMPYFCINVALMHKSEIIAAVTYQPITDEWFWTQKGMGAFLNGQKLDLQQRWKQTGVLVVVSDAMLRNQQLLNGIKQLFKTIQKDVRFRVHGAAALDLAYAASGMIDVAIFQNLHWWDVATGVLLVPEAGGWISQHDGAKLDQDFKSIIAGDVQLCEMIINLIKLQK